MLARADAQPRAARSAGAQKLLGVLITIGEAVAYVVSGMYGDVRELGTVNAVLIIMQARAATRNMRAAPPRDADAHRARSCSWLALS